MGREVEEVSRGSRGREEGAVWRVRKTLRVHGGEGELKVGIVIF